MAPKLKIKDSLYILQDSENNYFFVSTATRRIKKFKVDNLVKEIIGSLETETLESNLIKKLSSQYKIKEINLCLKALEKEGIIRIYEKDFEKGRSYKQLLFLDELTNSQEETFELQKKIKNSKIAVFGVGGIGTWIVNGLHQIGVGEIRISDPDVVEETNLNRQLFFDTEDVGRYKVDVIKEKLKEWIKESDISYDAARQMYTIAISPKFASSLKDSRSATFFLEDMYKNKEIGLTETTKEIISEEKVAKANSIVDEFKYGQISDTGLETEIMDLAQETGYYSWKEIEEKIGKENTGNLRGQLTKKMSSYWEYFQTTGDPQYLERVLGTKEMNDLNNCVSGGGNFNNCFQQSHNFYGVRTFLCATNRDYCPVLEAGELYRVLF